MHDNAAHVGDDSRCSGFGRHADSRSRSIRCSFTTVQQVALVAKQVLDELQLRGYLKTSGATGLHILVPLIPNTFSHDRVRLIAAAIAKLIVDRRPDIATIERMI